jgi:1,4-dihydroxy-2-naphthoate octaprenyltransferase
MKDTTRLRPKLWLLALYTVPEIGVLKEADPVGRWLIMGRAAVLVMTALSAVLGGLFAQLSGVFHPVRFLAATCGLLLAHFASNLANDYFDFVQGKDTPDSPRVRYGPHPLAHQGSSPAGLLRATVLALGGAALAGLYLTFAAGPGVLVFAGLGLLILLGYTGGPLPLKYIGLGELAVLIVWGPLMVGGTYYTQAGSVPAWVLFGSLPYALGVTTVLLGKHLDKVEFDRARNVRTLPVVLGEAGARRLTQAAIVLMYLTAVGVAGWQGFPGMLAVLLNLSGAWKTLRFLDEPRPPNRPLWYVGGTFLHNRRFGLLLVGGLAAEVVVRLALGR